MGKALRHGAAMGKLTSSSVIRTSVQVQLRAGLSSLCIGFVPTYKKRETRDEKSKLEFTLA